MTLVSLAAALIAGCSGDAEPETTAARAGVAGESADGRNAAPAEAGSAAQARDDAAHPLPETQLTSLDRKLARTASMTVRAEDVARAAADARQIATSAGGYTGSERTEDDSATLTLIVPGEELDGVLDRLSELGERTERRVTVDDVTEQIVDVDSRVASQRKSVQRARELLDDAESIADLVTVERELAQREAELESLLARQEALRGRVAMAPIDLTLHEQADGGDDGGFLGGLAAGWGAFTALLGAAAEGLGVAMPFLVLAGVLAALALLARRHRRQARAAGSEAASGTA